VEHRNQKGSVSRGTSGVRGEMFQVERQDRDLIVSGGPSRASRGVFHVEH
jgi:hypothetical protein